jgi:hypothetical protein
VNEVWIVDEAVGRLGGWLEELDKALQGELERFESADLLAAAVQPHPSTYDFDVFVPGGEVERFGDPSVVFSLRDDRLWGTGPEDQAKRVGEVLERLQVAFPHAGAAALGPGEPGDLPSQIVEARLSRPDTPAEERWIRAMQGADLAIGVHGSNMLLPSALATATVELLPRGRYGNVLQASLVREADPLEALYRHRFIYGREDLADITPGLVADVAIAVLDGLDRFTAHSTGPAAGVGSGEPSPLPPSRASTRDEPPPTPLRERLQTRLADATQSRWPSRARRRDSDDHLIQAIEAFAGVAPLRLDARRSDSLDALAGQAGQQAAEAGAVVIDGLDRGGTPEAAALLSRLDELGLRPHTIANGSLVAVRPLGAGGIPTVLVALSTAVRERLKSAGMTA